MRYLIKAWLTRWVQYGLFFHAYEAAKAKVCSNMCNDMQLQQDSIRRWAWDAKASSGRWHSLLCMDRPWITSQLIWILSSWHWCTSWNFINKSHSWVPPADVINWWCPGPFPPLLHQRHASSLETCQRRCRLKIGRRSDLLWLTWLATCNTYTANRLQAITIR